MTEPAGFAITEWPASGRVYPDRVDVVSRMRSDLMAAMRTKQRRRVRVLRSTLAALANAEAQPDTTDQAGGTVSGDIAGAAAGVGSTEVPRRMLTVAEIAGVIAAERDERMAAAADLDRRGAAEQASALRAEAAILDTYL